MRSRALLEQAVVGDEVVGVVGAVGHHDRDRVAGEALEPGANGEPEAARVVRAEAADAVVVAPRSSRRPSAVPSVLASSMTRTSKSIASGRALGDDARHRRADRASSLWAGMTTESFTPRVSQVARQARLSARVGRRANVLVTGGAGFIGSHLVDRLLADGHERARCSTRSTRRCTTGRPGLPERRGRAASRATCATRDAVAARLDGVDRARAPRRGRRRRASRCTRSSATRR